MFTVSHAEQVRGRVSELKTTQKIQLEMLNKHEEMVKIDEDITRLRGESRALQERVAKGLNRIQWSLSILALVVVLIPVIGVIFFI